jgi:taurine dioxygenase
VETKPLSPHLGVEILGLDAREVESETALDLAALLLRHGILLLRGQDISAGEQVRFSRHFGELEHFPVEAGNGAAPAEDEFVFRVSNDSRRGYRGVGLYWHTDGYFHERPTAVSILRAVTVPPSGGDTSFANMTVALEALPEDLREQVESLVGVSRPAPGAKRSGGLFARSSATGTRHPLVRAHPLNQEPVLYLNVGNMVGIEGWKREEALALIERLADHVESGDFTYRHRWQSGDMMIWDNAGVAHRASAPPQDSLRLMERTSVVGDEYFDSFFWTQAAVRACVSSP